MAWVMTKAPACWPGTTLTEDDLGTIKIALASAAAEMPLNFWGRVHPGESGTNIYDRALDRVLAMEEEATSLDLTKNELLLDALDRLTPEPTVTRHPPTSWFSSLFLWF